LIRSVYLVTEGFHGSSLFENLPQFGVPPEISAAVYDHYVSLFVSRCFNVAPDDTFRGLFRQAHEDADDDAEDLVKALDLELPMESVLRQWETPVETLRDMVLWLNWIRQRQA
jgi:hypothetical protein